MKQTGSREDGKVNTIAKIAAGILCLMLVFVSLSAGSPSQAQTYKIVCLGDSIIGNFQDSSSLHQVSERLGVSVLNGAFGGTMAAEVPAALQVNRLNQSLSLVQLAEAIVYRDFAPQRAEITYGSAYQDMNRQILDYFPDTLAQLEQVDFSQVDILLIEHGTNDYNSGTVTDNPEEPYDTHTFGGALRYSIGLLQEAYPHMRIILMTPAYCYFENNGDRKDCIERDFGYGNLQVYVDLEIEIARECGVEVIDNFRNLGIHAGNGEQYLEDGLHLNEAGRVLLGNHIADYLLEES